MKSSLKKSVISTIIAITMILNLIPFKAFAITTYVVHFDTQGGTSISSQIIGEGRLAIRPKDPVNGDLEFLGWKVDNYTSYNFTEPVTKDITVYAEWKVTMNAYTYPENAGIVYIGNNSSGATDKIIQTWSLIKLTEFGMLKQTANNGYNFKEWRYGSPDGEVVETDSSKGVTLYGNDILFKLDKNYTFCAIYEEHDHTIEYIPAKKATQESDGSYEYYKCRDCDKIFKDEEGTTKTKIEEVTLPAIDTITLSKTSFTYNGKVQKPSVTVKDSLGNIIDKTNYTVNYSSGCKNVGKYTVTITFNGNYSGSKKITYNIVPKGTSLSKVTAGSKRFTAKWKKQTSQTSGYQIRYSLKSNMSGSKTVTIGGNKNISKVVKNLKAKKKYYVQVRTYKTVSGTKYYSGWSAKKAVTTKK